MAASAAYPYKIKADTLFREGSPPFFIQSKAALELLLRLRGQKFTTEA